MKLNTLNVMTGATLFLLLLNLAMAGEQDCSIRKYGRTSGLSKTICDSVRGKNQEMLNFQGRVILQDSQLFEEDSYNSGTVMVFTSATLDKFTNCHSKLYLVDVSTSPVTVIAFGVKQGCNEFDYASWGKKNSVIAIKSNVKFVYQNGKMMLPKDDQKLRDRIEPSHGDDGYTQDDPVLPFVQYLSSNPNQGAPRK